MRRISFIYSGLLFLFSLVMLLFILAGSHGRLIFANSETFQGLAIMFLFILTGVVGLIKTDKTNGNLVRVVRIGLNGLSIFLICHQIILLKPETFTLLSGSVIGLHILGVILGAIILYRLVRGLK